MATSILDPPAFTQACNTLSDKLERMPVSILTGPNRAKKLVEGTARAHGARRLVSGTAADALARSIRCKTLAAASVALRLRANSLRTAHALASAKRPRSDKSHGTVTAEGVPLATLIGAETIEAAVLFADMRGYTGLAEQLPPAQVVSLLNEFFTVLARVTVAYGGEVFHMAGDGMMAGFGVRDPKGSGARVALAAGHAMLQSFAPVAARWRQDFAVITGIGIGIHVGEVALGFLGPPGKQAITMIGDTANVALTPSAWDRERRHSFNCRNLSCAGAANAWISSAGTLRYSRAEYPRCSTHNISQHRLHNARPSATA